MALREIYLVRASTQSQITAEDFYKQESTGLLQAGIFAPCRNSFASKLRGDSLLAVATCITQ
jgi:hypothetical protein